MTDQRAGFDINNGKTLIGLSNAGDRSIVELWADPITHELIVKTTTATPTVATFVTGQQTATTNAAALPNNALTQGVTVSASIANTVSVFVGPSGVTTGTGFELPPGGAVTVPVSNSNLIYIRCASTSPTISFIGV